LEDFLKKYLEGKIMGFTTNCFIRKNTPELRKKLEELGIPQNDFDEGNRPWIAYNYGMWITVDEGHNRFIPNDIDCGDNEDLFFALTALRDNSDYMQWFVSPKTRPKISPGYCGQIVGMDGQNKEIVGYEWYRYGNKDNALTERLNAMVQMEAEDMEFEPHKATVEELIEHFKR
jgi:hypothetical protein